MGINRRGVLQAWSCLTAAAASRVAASDWPAFRGSGGLGTVDGTLPLSWNANDQEGPAEGVLWRAKLPGLGHSSPILIDDTIFVASAIASDGKQELSVGRSGAPSAADDLSEHNWDIFAYDEATGEKRWQQTAHTGTPKVSRHVKATHANTTLTSDGQNLVAFFGSEGLYNFDLQGNLKWKRDLGVINISKYGIGWGYASSPAILGDRIVLLCDDPSQPFLICLELSTGKELWRVSRQDISVRSWATPLIFGAAGDEQIVINGWPWIVSYNLSDGAERWRLKGGGDNPVPTPFVVDGLIYITNAHGGQSPIYVVRPEARGDISLSEGAESNEAIVWSHQRGGSYMSTPVVYGDHLYLGNTNGILRCFNKASGERIYEERLGPGASIYASLVAGDGKVYCTSENGTVFVVKSGPEFQVLARNNLGSPCLATPIAGQGKLIFRTTNSLLAVGRSK